MGMFIFGLLMLFYYDRVLMKHFEHFNQISVDYALLGSLNTVAFMMAAQTSMYVAGYQKASVVVMCVSMMILLYRPLRFLPHVGGGVTQVMHVLILLGLTSVFATRRKGTAKSIAGYAGFSLASFMMGLLVFGKIDANSKLVPWVCESTENSCRAKLFDQRRLDVGFADMIQSKFYFDDCMYGEAGVEDKLPATRYCRDNWMPYQMPCEERGLDPKTIITDLAENVGPSYLAWPPVDPAPKRPSNPYAWMGLMLANEWFDNMFWIDLGIRGIYMILLGLLQVHPMENGKLTLERIAALDVRLVEVLFIISAPTFAVSMIMMGMMDPYFDTSTLKAAAIMAGPISACCAREGLSHLTRFVTSPSVTEMQVRELLPKSLPFPGATTAVTTTWLTLYPGSPHDYSAESRGRLVFWRAAHAASFLSAVAFTVTAMILRLEPYLVAVVLFLLCSIGSMSRSKREKSPVESAKVYGALFATSSVVFFAYGLVYGGYEHSHAHFVKGESGNPLQTVVLRYVVWAGFHAAMFRVFWRIATRTDDAAGVFNRLGVSASSMFGVVLPVALAQYMIRYRFVSEICEGSGWCDLDATIRSAEESWKWNGSAWVGANDDWESVVEWAIRVREYQIAEHRAETAVVALSMAVLAAFLPKQAFADVKVSVRCLETVGLSTLEYAYGCTTLAAMAIFTVADVTPTPYYWIVGGALGIASLTLWCAVTDRKQQLADLKKSKELAPESPEEETAKLRMFFVWFSIATVLECAAFFLQRTLVDIAHVRQGIKRIGIGMAFCDMNLPFKYLLWHSMKSLRLDTVRGSTWVVLGHNFYRYLWFWMSFSDSAPFNSYEYGHANVASVNRYFVLIVTPELFVQADLWKNWRMDSRRFFWKVVPGLIPITAYYARLGSWVSMNRFGYTSEIESVNHWWDFGNRCNKLSGYAQLAFTVSKPPAMLRDFVMRRVIENCGGIAYFQLMMLSTGPMLMYSFARMHLSIPRLQSQAVACREWLNLVAWFGFYVTVLGVFASKQGVLALLLIILKIIGGWTNAYCIFKVKDSSMADELRRLTMESRSSRLTRSLRASMAERRSTVAEGQLPRVLDRPSTRVGPDALPEKKTSGPAKSEPSRPTQEMQ